MNLHYSILTSSPLFSSAEKSFSAGEAEVMATITVKIKK